VFQYAGVFRIFAVENPEVLAIHNFARISVAALKPILTVFGKAEDHVGTETPCRLWATSEAGEFPGAA